MEQESETDVNEGHPNEEDLEEAADGAEETDVSGAPQTGTEHEDLEPMDTPDEDAAGE